MATWSSTSYLLFVWLLISASSVRAFSSPPPDFSRPSEFQVEARSLKPGFDLPAHLIRRGGDGNHVAWPGAHWSMKQIGQPQSDEHPLGMPLKSMTKGYVSRKGAGRSKTIYVIEQSADLSGENFAHLRNKPGRIRWAGPHDFTPGKAGVPGAPGPRAEHGTQMLDKLFGKNNGLLPEVGEVVVVRWDGSAAQGNGEVFTDMINWVRHDWTTRARKSDSDIGFINMSLSTKGELRLPLKNPQYVRPLNNFRDALNGAGTDGLLTVASSGNEGGEIDSFPAVYGEARQYDPNGPQLTAPSVQRMVTVGATSAKGQTLSLTQMGRGKMAFAPGDGIRVQSAEGEDLVVGTSIPAIEVSAALIARSEDPEYQSHRGWGSNTRGVQKVDHLLEDVDRKFSYARQNLPGYPRVISNGVTVEQYEAAETCGSRKKRMAPLGVLTGQRNGQSSTSRNGRRLNRPNRNRQRFTRCFV